jgi:hypothetical protein
MVAYRSVKGREHRLLDFHVPTKHIFTYKSQLITKGLKTNFRRRRWFYYGGGGGSNLEKEVTRFSGI